MDYKNIGDILEYHSGTLRTSGELVSDIEDQVRFFISNGIERNSRVIICHGNNIRFFVDLLALWHIGACALCVDTQIGITEFENIVDFCETKYAVYNASVPDKLKPQAKKVTFLDTRHDPVGNGSSNPPPFARNMDDPALILFTSGTTGTPKGVVHTKRTLSAKWELLPNHMPLTHMSTTICLLPTNFGHGLICNCLYPLLNGKTLIIMRPYDPAVYLKFGEIVNEHEPTYMSSVPSLWKAVLTMSAPPKKRRFELITCGSAPLSARLWSEIQDWSGTKRVWNAYGITEVGSWVAGTSGDDVYPQDGLIGKGWGCEIRLTKGATIDLNNRSLREGHIWLKTPTLMQGYLNQPELTANVVQEGWFYTGDIGYFDAQGQLFISGRVRNEINFGGIKVIPEDIDLMLSNHAAIKESCTFGQAEEISGQIVATAVVFKNDTRIPSVKDLQDWAKQYVSDYKVPKVWYRVDQIPKTARGKMNRDDVRVFCERLPRMT